MKQKITFFSISVLLFIVVFYHQNVGINLGLFSSIIFVMSYYIQRQNGINRDYKIAMFGGILSSWSYAYFQDFTSFLVLLFSWHWIAMLMFDPKLQFLKSLILVPMNYFMSIPNFGKINWGISGKQIDKAWQKSLAYVIVPVLVSIAFIVVYTLASSTVSDFFANLTFDFEFDALTIFWLTVLGGVLMFSFWFFDLPKEWKNLLQRIPDSFSDKSQPTKPQDVIIKSGEITFVMLNIILIIFIAIYGYENFAQEEARNTISKNVHERVYAVIASIVMAIALILFLFRKELNFDLKNDNLKKLTFSWIILNMVMILVTFIKNSQYVYMLGLTEKRLGVFAFLILSLIGLYFTFCKVKRIKTNWYLFNKMSYAFYFTALVIAVINWSWIITKYNISTNQIHLAMEYHKQLDYNDVLMFKYFKNKKESAEVNAIQVKYRTKDVNPEFDGNFYDSYVKYNLLKDGMVQR